jgi:hypothetical protein
MSVSLASKRGSRDRLKVRNRCGCSLCARQMRCTEPTESPIALASQQGNDRVLDLAAQRRQDHRPEQTVLFAPAHRDFLSAQHPPAVKEDIERYILGHAGKGAHAGYGKRWFETLKAAVEVIPNPLEGSVNEGPIRQ